VGTLAYKGGVEVVAYLSMAFGNPYGERWDIEEVVAACDLLVESGVTHISLSDTVGLATPKQIADVFSDVLAVHDGLDIGVHLHARPDDAAAKVRAAWGAGCRRFDAAIAGMGGCPFAQDALVGNLATEVLLAELKSLGAEMPDMRPIDGLIHAAHEIERKYGVRIQ
jgi:hydroxymethylglutaryl-CoA lyase